VVLNNRRVHYFGNGKVLSRHHYNKEQGGSYTIKGHKIQSITSGSNHSVMVTMKGAVFGFGCNNNHQLGMVDPSALLGDIVSTPNEVFATVTKVKGAARLPDGSVTT
jgi:alpha-tubulin suppressor-like RCC1 family protein